MPEYLSIKPPNIHGNNQACLNKLCKEITKSANFSIFFLPGLTLDSLDLSCLALDLGILQHLTLTLAFSL